MRICISIHGMQPRVGGKDLQKSRHYHGYPLTNADVFLILEYKTLRGDAGAVIICWVMRSEVYLLAILAASMAV